MVIVDYRKTQKQTIKFGEMKLQNIRFWKCKSMKNNLFIGLHQYKRIRGTMKSRDSGFPE